MLATPKSNAIPNASDQAASAYNNRGTAHLQVGNYDQAISDFTMAIEGQRNYQGEHTFGKAYYNRGLVHLAMGNYDDALKDFEQALLYSDEFSMPSDVSGTPASQFRAGMIDAQKRLLEEQKDISFRADRAEVRLALGKTHYAMGSYNQAIADLSEAIKLQPNSVTLAEIHTVRGIVYYDMGEYEQAISDFSDAIRLLSAIVTPTPTKIRLT